jgi:hypothetical protein
MILYLAKRFPLIRVIQFSLFTASIQQSAFGQFVGIGTSNPQKTLDVRGNQRFGGTSSYMDFDSATGKFTWSNARLWVPANQQLIQHSASAEGLYYSNPRLEYRNQSGQPVFFTNWNNGNGFFGNNLGIGTTDPQSRLHIVDGASGYSAGFFPGITYEGNGNRYVNLIVPSPNESGIIFGNASSAAQGGIVYNNVANPGGLQFRTNGNLDRMVIDANGNVGIGNYYPAFPLNFAYEFGDKISLLGSNGAHYGFGVKSNLMQIHTDGPQADIAFGYGSSSSFNENMRIKGNGNVGIGNDAVYKLDVGGRLRVRSGGSNSNSAGIWFNNNSNSEVAFVGMEDDSHVGFFGNNGAGWKLAMNTQSGALQINGSEGNAGEVIKSNGGGSPPSWGAVSSWLYNNTYQRTQTSTPVTVSTTGQYYLSDMAVNNFSIVVSSNAKLLVITDIYVSPNCCTGSCVNFGTNVYRNGTQMTVDNSADVCPPAGNNSTGTTGITMLNVTPATYTFATYASWRSGSPATITNGHVFIAVIGQ